MQVLLRGDDVGPIWASKSLSVLPCWPMADRYHAISEPCRANHQLGRRCRGCIGPTAAAIRWLVR